MRKTYIGWWAVSAVLFWLVIRHILFLEHDWEAVGLFLLVSGICFFVGFRRWKEYQEYQEDRQIRNDYLKGNTPKESEAQDNKP